jgi:hypothetical protein
MDGAGIAFNRTIIASSIFPAPLPNPLAPGPYHSVPKASLCLPGERHYQIKIRGMRRRGVFGGFHASKMAWARIGLKRGR